MSMESMIVTVAELARRWDMSPRHVQQLIKERRVSAVWNDGVLVIRKPVSSGEMSSPCRMIKRSCSDV